MESQVATRQEHLQKLYPFCQALDRVLQNVTGEPSFPIWHAAIVARCVCCDIEICGEELFALSQPPSAERANAKIGRLRRGDCARAGCNSYHYLLSFRPYGELNWPEMLQRIGREEDQPQSRRKAGLAVWTLWSLPLVRRFTASCFFILLLLVLRQWYIGGRIPLLREPAKLAVDPTSAESSPIP